MSDAKRCAKCREHKPRSEFPPGKRWSDGLYPYCLDCKSVVQREYRARHKEAISAKAAAAYAANPEPAKARRRKRYYEDPERAVREAVEWKRANPERARVARKKWQQANPAATREFVRKRYATRKGAPAIPFTPAQLLQRLAYFGGCCWMCGDVATEWDHVKPLTRGGWHCLSNLRPACRPCNVRKYNRWPL